MTLKRFALLCTAVPLLLCACAEPPPAPAAKSVSLTLAPGQKADVGAGITLAYDSYSDSRCPKTVWCIWAGELVYRFTITSAQSSESFGITLPKTSYVSKVGGARIDIAPSSVPPPAPAPDSAAAQYLLKLTVTRP